MYLQDVGDAGIGELAEIVGIGVTREGSAGFAERFGFVITIGVDERHAIAEEVEGMLPLLEGSEIAVVAVCVHDAELRSEATGTGLVQTGEGAPRIAEISIEETAEIVVHEAHPRGPVATVTGRLAQMLTENEGIVAAKMVIEVGVAVV